MVPVAICKGHLLGEAGARTAVDECWRRQGSIVMKLPNVPEMVQPVLPWSVLHVPGYGCVDGWDINAQRDASLDQFISTLRFEHRVTGSEDPLLRLIYILQDKAAALHEVRNF